MLQYPIAQKQQSFFAAYFAKSVVLIGFSFFPPFVLLAPIRSGLTHSSMITYVLRTAGGV